MTGLKILVAEDKEYLRNVIVENLPAYAKCLEACNIEEALEKVSEADAVILSTELPGDVEKSGGKTALRALKQKKDIPVVCITSSMASGVRINLLKEGVDDVMFKPFNPEELTLRLLRFVKKP